ncbi:MAG: hypothetical protein GY810_27400 [Aureispira sp.]|nr:hypothetical protein [Aureispira sp.]
MIQSKKTYWLDLWPIALIVFITILILNSLFEFMDVPNNFLLGGAGDGLSNYFYLTYHLKHGSGWMFDGLLYPYQENILYTDSALLIYLFNWVDNNIMTIEPNIVGIYHTILIHAFIACPIFVYAVLREYRVGKLFGVIASIFISFLAPQVLRIFAHFSLSYTFYIPMLWYFILRLMRSPKPWKWALGTIVSISLMSLMHPYYLVLGGFFVLGFAGLYTLSNLKNFKQERAKIISLLAASLVPIVVISFFLAMADPFDGDRHTTPYGMFVYTSNIEAVFLPSTGPFRSLMETYVKYKYKYSGEGYAYIGIVTLFILFFAFARFLKKLWTRRFQKPLRFSSHGSINIIMGVGILLLILSFALPFIYMEFLLDLVPKLKQFRSLGRFAWVFYYAATIFAAYFLYTNYKALAQHKAKALGINMLVVVFLVWGVDMNIKVREISGNLEKQAVKNNLFHSTSNRLATILEQEGYQSSDFQAILPLPYLHIGSEKFYLHGDDQTIRQSYACAYQTGIPIAAAKSARTSLSVSYKHVQLFSGPYTEKTILKDFKNDKPLLIITTPNAVSKFSAEELRIFEQSQMIAQDAEVILTALPLSAFGTKFPELKAKFQQQKQSFIQTDGIYKPTPNSPLLLNRFEDIPNDGALRGTGCFEYSHKPNTIAEFVLFEGQKFPNQPKDQPLELSFWMQSDDSHAGLNALFVEQYAPNGSLVDRVECYPKFGAYVYKDWVCPKINFVLKDPANSITLRVRHIPRAENIKIDDLLIKHQNEDVYWGVGQDEAAFIYNNFIIPN